MTASRIAQVAGFALVLIVLTGCAPHPMESQTLSSAITNTSVDSRAKNMCGARGTGVRLIAALDSNAGELRMIADTVETRNGWDDGVPDDPAHYVAICIYDVADQDAWQGNPSYMAQWATVDTYFAGNGILTFW